MVGHPYHILNYVKVLQPIRGLLVLHHVLEELLEQVDVPEEGLADSSCVLGAHAEEGLYLIVLLVHLVHEITQNAHHYLAVFGIDETKA